MLNPIASAAKRRLEEGRGLLELHSPSYDFSSGFFPKKVLEECFASFAEDARYEPDPRGDLRAREALVRYYGESFGVSLDPEKFFLTSGTSESYAWLFRLLSDSEGADRNRFLAPEPSYPLFEHIASYSRVSLDPYPVPTSGVGNLDLRELETRIRPETKGLLLVSPHNPTGKIHTQDELSSLEKIASDKKIPLIHDEVFSEWIWSKSLSGKNFPRLGRTPGSKAPIHFTLNGVSKMLGLPWLKLSWIYADGADAEKLSSLIQRLEMTADTFLSANGLAQKALPTLLKSRDFFIEPFQKVLRENLDFCLSEISTMKGLSAAAPEGGVSLCVETEGECDEEALAIDLIEKGLYLFPGYYFDFPEDGRTRLIFSIQHPREELKKGLEMLREYFGSKAE